MFKKILSVFVLVVALGLVGSMGVNAKPACEDCDLS